MPESPAAAMMQSGLSDEHFAKVIHYLAEGELVPLLGAGVNVCDRQAAEVYVRDRNLPSGPELSELLAVEYEYSAGRADRRDLTRVAQFAQARLRHSDEEHRLRDSLHRIFRAQYGPTSVHRFLAEVPRRTGSHILALTTNYDDALEQAFETAGEPYSVIFYRASRRGRCWLRHGEDTDAKVIARPERYTGLSLHERSVILKVHGAVDRRERRSFNDSYVISEDHYIDFLASTRLETLVPKGLLVPLLNSALLFLGYRLKDWNLRVILHELWANRDFEYPAWAVHRDVGRRAERDLVVANLLTSRLTVMYGPGGVGKSSLLRAGVVPRLRDGVGVPTGAALGRLRSSTPGRAILCARSSTPSPL